MDRAEHSAGHGQIGEEGVAVAPDQFAADGCCLVGCGQRLGAKTDLALPKGQIVQRRGQIGEKGVAVSLRQFPVQVCRLLGGG